MNFSRIMGSAVAYTWTRPSGRLCTVPVTERSVAIFLTQALNPTLWTRPEMVISTVFTAPSPA